MEKPLIAVSEGGDSRGRDRPAEWASMPTLPVSGQITDLDSATLETSDLRICPGPIAIMCWELEPGAFERPVARARPGLPVDRRS